MPVRSDGTPRRVTEPVNHPRRVGPQERPRWSVTVPVHNGAPHLTPALSEVVAQLAERDDAEIVVVDDAPPTIRRLSFSGSAGAVSGMWPILTISARSGRSTVRRARSGEFAQLLHDDDAVLPGFYDAMGQALADPDVVAAVCRARDIDADGTPGPTSRSYRTGTGVWTGALEAQAVSNRIRPPGSVARPVHASPRPAERPRWRASSSLSHLYRRWFVPALAVLPADLVLQPVRDRSAGWEAARPRSAASILSVHASRRIEKFKV